jgi:hypothetical protein
MNRPDHDANVVVASLDPIDQVDPIAGLEGNIDHS